MDKMADVLGRAGAWAGQNKYLSSIKNAFQTFMPLTIAGAISLLWFAVLVNDAEGSLGYYFEPIMALKVVNPAFEAVFNATIGCITIGVTFGVAMEIAEHNGVRGFFPGLLGIASLIAVTPLTHAIMIDGKAAMNAAGEAISFGGIPSANIGATGLFTGLIMGILSAELLCKFKTVEGLKIKMPETVPPGVARAFEDLIPAFLSITVIAFIGLICFKLTGQYINDVIKTNIQEPLMGIGSSIPGLIILNIMIMLFWLVGIHGNNMLAAVKEAILTPLMLENVNAFKAGKRGSDIPNIATMGFQTMFGEFGGSGVTIGLIIAIFIFSRREDNRAVATLSVAPGLFNINETVTFGIPLVLNPILGIPFILAPVCTVMLGYFLTAIGFCPRVVVGPPWTTPPVLMGFLATGGNIMGAVSQLLALVLSVVIYIPFLLAYERQQNRDAANA